LIKNYNNTKPDNFLRTNDRLESIRCANIGIKRKDENNQTSRVEDYLEVIYELVQNKGYATTVDISKYLGVSSPSVTKMTQRLDEMGLLVYEKYRGIKLTENGIKIAINIRNKHSLLSEFFTLIGVNEETANNDIEMLEHYLHEMSIKKLKKLVTIIKEKPKFLED
jgi:Mn-dependent DtxR family transcriptional regulator